MANYSARFSSARKHQEWGIELVRRPISAPSKALLLDDDPLDYGRNDQLYPHVDEDWTMFPLVVSGSCIWGIEEKGVPHEGPLAKHCYLAGCQPWKLHWSIPSEVLSPPLFFYFSMCLICSLILSFPSLVRDACCWSS